MASLLGIGTLYPLELHAAGCHHHVNRISHGQHTAREHDRVEYVRAQGDERFYRFSSSDEAFANRPNFARNASSSSPAAFASAATHAAFAKSRGTSRTM